jgi:hypothetical protein
MREEKTKMMLNAGACEKRCSGSTPAHVARAAPAIAHAMSL